MGSPTADDYSNRSSNVCVAFSTALRAVEEDDVGNLEQLLAASPSDTNLLLETLSESEGWGLLHYAAAAMGGRSLGCLRVLLSRQQRVDFRTKSQEVALHLSLSRGCEDESLMLLLFLCSCGKAEQLLLARDIEGKTPLFSALLAGQFALLEQLACLATPNSDYHDRQPIGVNGSFRLFSLFHRDVDAHGRNPLHRLILLLGEVDKMNHRDEQMYLEAVRFVVKTSPMCLNGVDNAGATPLLLAIEKLSKTLLSKTKTPIENLFRCMVDTDEDDNRRTRGSRRDHLHHRNSKSGLHPLHACVLHRNFPAFKTLLEEVVLVSGLGDIINKQEEQEERENVMSFLLAADGKGRSVLHQIVSLRENSGGRETLALTFLEALLTTLTPKQLQALLQARQTNLLWTPLHIVADRGDIAMATRILRLGEEQVLSIDFIQSLALTQDSNGKFPAVVAASKRNLILALILVRIAVKNTLYKLKFRYFPTDNKEDVINNCCCCKRRKRFLHVRKLV